MAQQIRPTLSKEEEALIKQFREKQAKNSEFSGNQPLIDALESCKRPTNVKGNTSFDSVKLAELMEAILGYSLKTVQNTIYQPA